MLENMMNVLREMEMDSTCMNCHKPFEEGDEGHGGMDGLFKICTPCAEAKYRLQWKVAQGIDITYRDGTTERIGGD